MTALTAATVRGDERHINLPCPTCGRARIVRNYPSSVFRQKQECRGCARITRTNTRRRNTRERARVIDWVVIDRLCGGRDVPYATRAERREVARRLLDRGYPAGEIADRSGLSERTIERYRRVAA